MGSQQLLLIAVGIVVVISMVMLALNMFGTSFADQVKDLSIHKINDIGIRANVYRKTPTASGGGGGSYEGFSAKLNNLLKGDNIASQFSLTETDDLLTISMTLITQGENNEHFRVWGTYTSDGLQSLRVYDPNTEEWVWLLKQEP